VHRCRLTGAAVAALLLAAPLAACAAPAEEGSADDSAPDPADGLAGAPSAGSGASDACAAEVAHAVAGDGVGPVRIGVAVRDLAARCPTRDTTVSLGEGLVERAVVVRLAGAPVVALVAGDTVSGDTVAGDTVSRVIVPAGGPRTAGGVGVGSTVAELRRAHGAVCGAVGEGVVVAAAAALPGVSFATSADYGRFTAGSGTLPDTARVTALWAHGGRSPCDA
jgi:hypothetical protein